uniref:Uncharacterized protein n=1 Tax=Arundo donax TaxID=35708 RepID=A0A0A9HFZ7_ARUDO
MARALVKWDCQFISYSLPDVERLECLCKLLHGNVSVGLITMHPVLSLIFP